MTFLTVMLIILVVFFTIWVMSFFGKKRDDDIDVGGAARQAANDTLTSVSGVFGSFSDGMAIVRREVNLQAKLHKEHRAEDLAVYASKRHTRKMLKVVDDADWLAAYKIELRYLSSDKPDSVSESDRVEAHLKNLDTLAATRKAERDRKANEESDQLITA